MFRMATAGLLLDMKGVENHIELYINDLQDTLLS
jgi:hypothetical protein